jgi:hypothetical protein
MTVFSKAALEDRVEMLGRLVGEWLIGVDVGASTCSFLRWLLPLTVGAEKEEAGGLAGRELDDSSLVSLALKALISSNRGWSASSNKAVASMM